MTNLRIRALSALVALGLAACGSSPSYLRFISRDSTYYQAIADACRKVRARIPRMEADGRKLLLDNSSLPPALRDLHPQYFRARADRLFMSIGSGRGSYGLAWQLNEKTGVGWELRTYAEGMEKVLFIRDSE